MERQLVEQPLSNRLLLGTMYSAMAWTAHGQAIADQAAHSHGSGALKIHVIFMVSRTFLLGRGPARKTKVVYKRAVKNVLVRDKT